MSARPIRIGAAAPRGQGRTLVLLLLAVALMAYAGALASRDAGAFYVGLVRPNWAPSPRLFGPVWSVLYLLMGISAWWVWRAGGGLRRARGPLLLFAAQLALNGLWSWLFFRWHLGGLAVFEICILWLLILMTIASFWRIKRGAALLLLPYLVWVGFATALSAATWHLNPSLL